MTELSYVLSNFERHFQPFLGRRIVLHGSREYAREIIARFGERYRFVGVMSSEPIEGPEFCGLPVLTEDELFSGEIDLLILTERVRYAEAVYQSLGKRCAENSIALYDMYGLDESELHRRAMEYHVLTEVNYPEWEKTLSGYSLVVFEVVDTLTQIKGEELILRPLFPALIASLRKQGVRLAFSMRRSFSETVQADAVRRLHPGEQPRLIRREGEDLSLRALQEAEPDARILYVGSGLVYEHILPQYYGLDVRRFMEQYDCLVPEVQSQPEAGKEAERLSRIREAIDTCDAVSFDLFDTLIQRCVPAPEDIFLLCKDKLKEAGIPSERFVERRRGVQRERPLCTLTEYYEDLRPLMGWSAEQAKHAEKLETELERSLLRIRGQGFELFRYAVERGKRVFITSDMYLPASVLCPWLCDLGIVGYERLFVSCDCRTDKRGRLFSLLRDACGETCRVLHIGDQPAADGLCRKAGIDFEALPLRWQSGAAGIWKRCMESAKNFSDRGLLGLTLAHLDTESDADTRHAALEQYGAAVIGPILLGYVSWLAEKLRNTDVDALLFFARDGWLPQKLYEFFRAHFHELPPSLYFYTSRHAAQLLCASRPERLNEVLLQSRTAGLTGPEILTRVYGLASECVSEIENETPENCVLRHLTKIREKEREIRAGTLRYAESLGLSGMKRCAVSDFFSSGTTQSCLQTVLTPKLQGFYAGNYKTSTAEGCSIEYYFHGRNDTLFRNYMELEGIFTSPEASTDHIDATGQIVFSPEHRSEEMMADAACVQQSALAFVQEYLRLFGFPDRGIASELIEEIFAANPKHLTVSPPYNDLTRSVIERKSWQQIPGNPRTGGNEADDRERTGTRV